MFMGNMKRDFKGVWVPKEVWLNKELSASEKLVFIEIHSLDNEFGCVANNEHFVEMFGLSERAVQHNIKALKEKGLIDVEINKKDDSRVIRAIGKFIRIHDEDIARLGILRTRLAQQYRINRNIRY